MEVSMIKGVLITVLLTSSLSLKAGLSDWATNNLYKVDVFADKDCIDVKTTTELGHLRASDVEVTTADYFYDGNRIEDLTQLDFIVTNEEAVFKYSRNDAFKVNNKFLKQQSAKRVVGISFTIVTVSLLWILYKYKNPLKEKNKALRKKQVIK
jgi:hypothetical protein